MKTIDCKGLIEKLNENHSSFRLLNALEPSPVRMQQIPNSLNILQKEDLLQRLSEDDEIVVYCTDSSCNKSVVLYYQLEQMGYKNVSRYAGGIRDWVSNGQALEEIPTYNVA
jgi:rhodanese-related sulfurtransferase